MTYATIGKDAQRVSQLAFVRLLARGQAYQLEAPTLWDVDFRTAVAQAELEDREMPGAYHKIQFARADGHGVIEIDTTRPELIPACVALVAHPDDPRYRAAVRDARGDAALRRARADPRPRAGRARKGHRHRDDLHVRRHDRRHLVARTRAAGARRHPGQRDVQAADVGQRGMGVGSIRPPRKPATTDWWDCPSARRAPGSSSPARARHDDRRAAADHARREVLREGRSSARDHHEPPVVHPHARASRAPHRARSPDGVASRAHAASLRELDHRAQRRLVRQPPALLRRAAPGLVSARRAGAARLRAPDWCPTRRGCRSIPRRMCPTATRADQRDQPGGFTGGPRRHGHVGDVIALAAGRVGLGA